MSRYSKKNKVSEQTRDEAQKIARGTQKPGQTKEQTRLIAQGIQKGIDQYKKQQKAKTRELNKKLKQVTQQQQSPDHATTDNRPLAESTRSGRLPWILLVFSWLIFALYVFFTQSNR